MISYFSRLVVPASNTLPGCRVHGLRVHGLSLRVVAPHARQRAALHEHGGADAGSIVDGEFLDIENQTVWHLC